MSRELHNEWVDPPRRRRRHWGMWLLAILLVAVIGAGAVFGREGMSRLDYFQLRSIEVEGVQYLPAADVVQQMRVDTMRSVWDDNSDIARRLLNHPQITAVQISRKLPGTLLVTVDENLPVALVADHAGMQPVDTAGVALPIDPATTPLDLPIARSRDPALLALLGRVRGSSASLFRRISEVKRESADDALLLLTRNPRDPVQIAWDSTAAATSGDTIRVVMDPPLLRVRAPVGVQVARLADIFSVEFDLRRRGARASELDLRYRDQVIARLQ